ncbi:MAG: hypothetical protein IJJ70_07540 [Treponema sp.]|nr:hypothetical protein [Treponema sp.]MBR0487533.1 hypothetical protein [Treponema sp.]
MKKLFKNIFILTSILLTFSVISCKENEDTKEETKDEYALVESDNQRTRSVSLTLYPDSKTGLLEENITYTAEDKEAEIDKSKFKYSVDTEKKQFTITVTQIYNSDTKKWMTVSQMVDYYTEKTIGVYSNIIYAAQTAEQNPTYQNLYAIACAFSPDEEITYEEFLSNEGYSEEDDPEKIRTEVLKGVSFIKLIFGITDDNYDQVVQQLTNNLKTKIQYSLYSNIPDNTIFEYKEITGEVSTQYPTGKWFEYIKAIYDDSKDWYRQLGIWVSDDGNTSLSLSEIASNGSEIDDEGRWNETFTEYTYEDSNDNEASITVTDNNDGTITATIGGKNYTLNFVGLDITKEDPV